MEVYYCPYESRCEGKHITDCEKCEHLQILGGEMKSFKEVINSIQPCQTYKDCFNQDIITMDRDGYLTVDISIHSYNVLIKTVFVGLAGLDRVNYFFKG